MMSRRQDLDRLCWAASGKNFDAWSLIMRVHTDLFASIRTHDRKTIVAFEDLALALVPRIDGETAAYVERILVDLPAPPSAVLAALSARRSPASETTLEPNMGRSDSAIAGGFELQARIDRAGRHPDLARALLDSGGLPALEAARLYLFADRRQRDDIRSALAGAGMAGRRPIRLPRPSQKMINGLLDAADHHDAAAFGARLADCIGLASIPEWRFERSERHDFLALTVSAIGLCETEAIRIFLTLVPDIARSVQTVYGLVDIFRGTPRAVSYMILEAALDLDIPQQRAIRPHEELAQDLADRAGRVGQYGGTMPEMRERERQLRPRFPGRAG